MPFLAAGARRSLDGEGADLGLHGVDAARVHENYVCQQCHAWECKTADERQTLVAQKQYYNKGTLVFGIVTLQGNLEPKKGKRVPLGYQETPWHRWHERRLENHHRDAGAQIADQEGRADKNRANFQTVLPLVLNGLAALQESSHLEHTPPSVWSWNLDFQKGFL